MVQALGAQSVNTEWTKDNGQFIPHPSTWLNGKRWEDEVPEPAPAANNVHQFPPRRQANGPDFDNRAWAENLDGGL